MSDQDNSHRWSSRKYKAKRAEQRIKKTPSWVSNPRTGHNFFLRKVNALAYTVAGAMPHTMTNKALDAWAEQGVGSGAEMSAIEIALGKRINKGLLEEGQRSVHLMAKVISEGCVIPQIVPGYLGDDDQIIDPVDLDDEDVLFIFQYCTGQIGAVELKGGEQVAVEDLQNFSEQPGVSAGAGADGAELLPTTEPAVRPDGESAE